MRILLAGFALFFVCATLNAQQPSTAPRWDAWQYLMGDWVAEGGGAPGQGAGTLSFSTDLEGRILVRKNHVEYPATSEHPARTHDDLMLIYEDPHSRAIRAIFLDAEGHVIHYAVAYSADGKIITQLSDLVPGQPRFRFTYTQLPGGELGTRFEIAPPDKPGQFAVYVEGKAHRKKGPG